MKRVPQHFYEDMLRECGPMSREDLATTFEVSDATAKRNLDGLVFQGKIEVVQTRVPQSRTVYGVPVGEQIN